MSSTKVTSLYQYLLFYGAVPHLVYANNFRCELPNEENFHHWREYHRRILHERDGLDLPPGCSAPLYHWPHIRLLKDEETPLVAFYASEDAAKRDRRTRCTYGRYLTKYFSAVLTAKQIAELATQFRGNYGNNCLLFARTPEEITNVYLTGPNSCMSKPVGHYATSGIHPSIFYANGITEIAYLRNHGKITARTVVLKAQKKFSTIYGDQAIRDKLKAAGYTPGDINDVDFPIVEHPQNTPTAENIRFILPFIDSANYGVYHYANRLIRFHRERPDCPEGTTRFVARNTDGTAYVPSKQAADTNAAVMYTCAHCSTRNDHRQNSRYVTTDGQSLCSDCSEHYTTLRTSGVPTYHHGIPPGDNYRVHGYSTRYCQTQALRAFEQVPLDHKYDEHGTRLCAHRSEVRQTITGYTSLHEDCVVFYNGNERVYCDPRLEGLDADEKVYVDKDHTLYLFRTPPTILGLIEFSASQIFRDALIERSGHALTLFAREYQKLLTQAA